MKHRKHLKPQEHTLNFDDVREAEAVAIAKRREARGVAKDAARWGLALSGGGIRSASFALGVLQSLHDRGLYKHVDYLSTVSGGGYIGSALAWFTRQPDAGFPFTDGAPELSYVQRHADYLNPRSGGISIVALIATVLSQTMVSLLVYGSLLVGLFFLWMIADAVFDLVKPALESFSRADAYRSVIASLNSALAFALAILPVLLIWHLGGRVINTAGRALLSKPPPAAEHDYHADLKSQRVFGAGLVLFACATVFGSVPLVNRWLSAWLADETLRTLLLTHAVVFATSVALKAFGPARPHGKDAEPPTGNAMLIESIAASATLYTLLLATHSVAHLIVDSGAVGSVFVVVGCGVVVGFGINLNLLGPGRIYRDRLAEAFLPNAEAVSRGEWQPATEATSFPLHALAQVHTAAPYPLINANLITVGSATAKYRDRGGDSFVLTPHYCGSEATGWRKTSGWPLRPMTLASAMAISGAAVSPDAGSNGHGSTHKRVISALMTLLNLRLGFWVGNPNPAAGSGLFGAPSLISPGLIQGVFGLGLTETARRIQLSDGGHFDDLGIYELVRRELDVIVVSDAALGIGCGALANAAERIRTDFGARLSIDTGAQLSELGHQTGTIRYASGRKAVVIYLKAMLTTELPVYVRGYAEANPAFPQQPTSDQFFDEAQFEAYRALGYATTSRIEPPTV